MHISIHMYMHMPVHRCDINTEYSNLPDSFKQNYRRQAQPRSTALNKAAVSLTATYHATHALEVGEKKAHRELQSVDGGMTPSPAGTPFDATPSKMSPEGTPFDATPSKMSPEGTPFDATYDASFNAASNRPCSTPSKTLVPILDLIDDAPKELMLEELKEMVRKEQELLEAQRHRHLSTTENELRSVLRERANNYKAQEASAHVWDRLLTHQQLLERQVTSSNPDVDLIAITPQVY